MPKRMTGRRLLMLAAGVSSFAIACTSETQKASTGIANEADAQGDGATDSAAMPIKTVQLGIAKDALATTSLATKAFVSNPCLIAEADNMAKMWKFSSGDVSRSQEERNDRPACLYRSEDPETDLRIYFDESKRKKHTESLELAGVPDVRLRSTTRGALLTISFPAAKNAQKRPADRIVIDLSMFASSTTQSWEPSYQRPDAESMRALLLALGENLISRLGLAGKG